MDGPPFKFDFYEKVRISTTDPGKQSENGQIGAVLGKAQDDDGIWSYAVWLYRKSLCWSFNEGELASTGEFDSQESFYSGESLRMRADKAGRGYVVGDEGQ